MNERDKALGRLLLARNQVARETLHQAAATTEARRAAGQQVEVVAVLVEMGALQTDAARAVWAEVAHVPPVPGGPPSGTFQRLQAPPAQPTFPARAATPPHGVQQRPAFPTGQRPAPMLSGEGDFSPVSTLSTMGEAPPQLPMGHDPLRSSRTMAAVPPSHLPPPARVAAPQAPLPMAGLGAPPAGSFPPNMYLASPGRPTILDPSPATPTFGPPPSFGPGHPPNGLNGSNLFASGGFGAVNPAFGGSSSGFGGGYSTAPVPLPPAEDLAAPFDAGGATLGLPPGHAAALAASPAPFPSPGFASYPAPAAIGTPVAPSPSPAVLGPEVPLGEAASPSPEGKKKRGTSARLGPQGKKTKAPAAPARPGSNTTLILGGAACVAFLLVAGVAFAVRGGQTPAGGAPSSTTTAPPQPALAPGGTSSTSEAEPEQTPSVEGPRKKPPAEQGQRSLGLQSTPIQAEKDDASHRWADEVLAAASILQDQEKYDDALAALDKFPEAMRTGEGFARVQRLRATVQLYAGFKRRLDDAIKEGPTSLNLKKLVARVEGNKLEEEVKHLPCVARFQEEARKVLGDDAYNDISMSALELDDIQDKE